MTRRTIISCLMALGLAGCALGPAWHPPPPPSATSYVAGKTANGTIGVEAPTGTSQVFEYGKTLRRDWYRLFGNHALNRLIQMALSSNPAEAAARARLAAAHEAVVAAQGGHYPSVSFGASISRNRASGVTFGIQSPSFVNTFNLYQGELTAAYNLNLFGGLTRRIENARALAAAEKAQLMDTDATIVNNIISSALADAAARTTLRLVHVIVAYERRTLSILNKQLRYGTVSRSDVLRARIRLDNTLARIPALHQQIAVARHRLAVLTGQEPSQAKLPTLKLSAFRLPKRIPVSLPAELVRQRPDIVLAENLVHAAQANVGLAEAQLLPHVELTAGIGRVGLHPGDLTNPAAAIFNVGAGLMAPLFEGGKLRARKRQAQDQYEAALADYQRVVLHAFGQVANSLRALQQDARTLAAREQACRDSRQSLKLVELRKQQGTAGAVSLYSSRIEIQNCEIAYNRARLARLVDTATLIRALGGGWWHHNSTTENSIPSSRSQANSP